MTEREFLILYKACRFAKENNLEILFPRGAQKFWFSFRKKNPVKPLVVEDLRNKYKEIK